MATKNAKLAAGLGAAAAAAAAAGAAGYYFYASTNAKQHRQTAAKWANGLKNEILKQAKKAKKLDRAQMLALIDGAVASYEKVRNLDKNDLRAAAKELRDNWQSLKDEMVRDVSARPAKTSVRKAARTGRASARKASSRIKRAVRK